MFMQLLCHEQIPELSSKHVTKYEVNTCLMAQDHSVLNLHYNIPNKDSLRT